MIFHNRETYSAAFCVIHQMYIKPPLPFYATLIINPFLNSIISASHKKGEEFQPIVESFYLFFSLESLLFILTLQLYKIFL